MVPDRTLVWAVHTVGIMIIELLLIFGSLQNVNLDDPKKSKIRFSYSGPHFWAGATVPSIRKRGFILKFLFYFILNVVVDCCI